MKRASMALALTALVAATIAGAQTTPDTRADQLRQDPRQTTGRSSESSTADKQALMHVCVTQVQVSNPRAPEKNIKDFCEAQVNKLSSQH